MTFRAIVVGLLFLATSCLAHDADGKWNGTFDTPNGPAPVTFNFKADGATLNGSTTGPDGSEIKIANGKVDGNDISFSVTFDFGGMPLKIDYKGVVSKEEIKFKLEVFGMPFELTVKKAS